MRPAVWQIVVRCRIAPLSATEDSYRLSYVRGPEGITIELAEQIG
jgi:hypothetical protein